MHNTSLERNILRLKLIPEIGNKTIIDLIKTFPAEFNSEKLPVDVIRSILTKKKLESFEDNIGKIDVQIDKVLEEIRDNNIKVLNYFDESYPASLKNTFNPPIMLFYKGDLLYDYHKSLAIVGSRKNSPYGEMVCHSFIETFGIYKFSIISGLAMGIDAIAHKAGLKNKCKCIGVIGSGFNHIYPYSNKKLYDEVIQAGGCIISEFIPDAEPHPGFFPLRNRIIAGLARGTLVIEAAEKSGSLITARYAFDESREVFAVPADINRTSSTGCNDLIRSNIAKIITKPQDIIDEYGIDFFSSERVLKELDTHEHKDLLQLLSFERLTSDEISISTGKNISEVNAILTELEMEDLIATDAQMKWFRRL